MKKKISHMSIPWHNYVRSGENVSAAEATLPEKSSLIGRIGTMMLSCGTPAWRVRNAMTTVAISLGVTCTSDIGINALNYTCIDKEESSTQAVSIAGTSVNTYKLMRLEHFINEFDDKYRDKSVESIHSILDGINSTPETHSIWVLSLAAAAACASFAFLLGAGLTEIIFVFISAFVGQLIRKLLLNQKLSVIISIAASAAAACSVFVICRLIAEGMFNAPGENGAGYICAVLFLVPGFPFITSVLDLAKLDLRSGAERLVYSVIIMLFATTFAWAGSLIFGFEAENLAGLSLPLALLIILRLVASFAGIYGFSLMFNSTHKMALCAALVGTIPNVIRVELAREAGLNSAIAAFISAFLVGLVATLAVKITSYPRIAITIPAVIVSIPGFFMYQSIYFFGTGRAEDGLGALVQAGSIILATSLGILFSRYISDPQYRHRD